MANLSLVTAFKKPMPAKTSFYPVKSAVVEHLQVDNSFEQNLMREFDRHEFKLPRLEGTPMQPVLGGLLRNVGEAGADQSALQSMPESRGEVTASHRAGEGLSTRNRIRGKREVFATSDGMIFRIWGITEKEAGITEMGITASFPKVLPIDRFYTWASTRTVYCVVNKKVYSVVTFSS